MPSKRLMKMLDTSFIDICTTLSSKAGLEGVGWKAVGLKRRQESFDYVLMESFLFPLFRPQ